MSLPTLIVIYIVMAVVLGPVAISIGLAYRTYHEIMRDAPEDIRHHVWCQRLNIMFLWTPQWVKNIVPKYKYGKPE